MNFTWATFWQILMYIVLLNDYSGVFSARAPSSPASPSKFTSSSSQCDCIEFEPIVGKEYGVFMSPDWPASYDIRSRCLLYIFNAPAGHIVELTFDEFDLQRSDGGCDYSDHVRLYLHLPAPGLRIEDAWSTLLCGRYSDIEPTHFSSGRMLSFQFHANSRTTNATGFRGTFRFLNKALFRTDGQLMPNTQCDYVFRHDILARAQGVSGVDIGGQRRKLPFGGTGLNRRIHSTESIWDFDDDELRFVPSHRPLHSRKPRSFSFDSATQSSSTVTTSAVVASSPLNSLALTFGPGTSVSAKGHFYSPQYPSTYPRHSRCLYRFQAKPGERVHLHFTDLNLRRLDESCHTSPDVVNVYDGVDTTSPLIAQLCGASFFVEVTSTAPEVLVEFSSQGYIAAKGFRAEFAFISTIVPSSPPTDFWQNFAGSDNDVSDGVNRSHLATSSATSFSTSSSSPTVLSTTSKPISGSMTSTSSSSETSNSSSSSSSVCDFWFSSDAYLNGTITSPRYPLPYPDNIVCRYHFVGGGKQRVQIAFRHFDVHRIDENARDCEISDSLTAWVFTGGQQERIDSFCGNDLPPRIMSNGPRLTLEFHAKSRAWHRQQRRQHRQQHNSHRLTVHSEMQRQASSEQHEQHLPNRQHAYVSNSPQHEKRPQQSTDAESSVAAYQRFTHQLQKAQTIQRLKQKQHKPLKQASSELLSSVYPLPEFKPENDEPDSDERTTRQARGFEATYRFVTDFGIESGKQDSKSVCGFVFNSSDASTGTFSSPNYPGLYPKNTECHFFFYGTATEQVHIDFHHFDVEGVVPCTLETASDYLEFSSVHSTDRRPTRHCGVKHPPKIVSESDFFRVTFKSNSRFDGTGFQAVYTFRPRTDDYLLQQKKARSSLTTLIGSMSSAPETGTKTVSTPNPPRSGSKARTFPSLTTSVLSSLSVALCMFSIIQFLPVTLYG